MDDKFITQARDLRQSLHIANNRHVIVVVCTGLVFQLSMHILLLSLYIIVMSYRHVLSLLLNKNPRKTRKK